jgi:hypothetical protein
MRVLALVEDGGGWVSELGADPISSLREIPARLGIA